MIYISEGLPGSISFAQILVSLAEKILPVLAASWMLDRNEGNKLLNNSLMAWLPISWVFHSEHQQNNHLRLLLQLFLFNKAWLVVSFNPFWCQ